MISSDSNRGRILDASAGLTALVDPNGTLLTFGLNHHGQCGVGQSSNNVWTPSPVMGLSSVFAHDGRESQTQEHAICQVSLGLQHGIALNSVGHVYVWGKGERGQLGLLEAEPFLAFAKRVTNFRLPSTDGSRQFHKNPIMTMVAAGMNHCVTKGQDNQVYIWGKNVMMPPTSSSFNSAVQDATTPTVIRGLPPDREVVDITCGSHHTSLLLEDGSVYGLGIPRDSAKPIWEAIRQVPAGVIDMPPRQFEGHFDRTTIVGNDGRQVLQVQLWSEETTTAVFTPIWRDVLSCPIQSVHRGWLHSLIVTEE